MWDPKQKKWRLSRLEYWKWHQPFTMCLYLPHGKCNHRVWFSNRIQRGRTDDKIPVQRMPPAALGRWPTSIHSGSNHFEPGNLPNRCHHYSSFALLLLLQYSKTQYISKEQWIVVSNLCSIARPSLELLTKLRTEQNWQVNSYALSKFIDEWCF